MLNAESIKSFPAVAQGEQVGLYPINLDKVQDGVRFLTAGPSFVKVSASRVTLFRFLRRTETVEGSGFDPRPIGRSEYSWSIIWTKPK